MTNDREARRRAAEREGELRAEAERGAYAAGEPSRMLFGEWCEAWARSEGPFWRASLRQKRLQRMAVWVEPYLAAERLCDLAEAQLRRWHGEMIQHAGRKGKGHTQVAHAWRDVSAALGAAHRDGLIPRNPALGALPRTRRRAAPPSPRRALTPLEVERIRLHLLNDARDAALVSLLAYCGLRPEEAVALEWASVLDGRLRVERAYSHGELGSPKTSAGRRPVAICQPVADDLERLRREHRADGLVFPGKRGGYRNLGNWRARRWHVARKAGDVQLCTPEDLRHTFASLLIQEGRSAVDVAAQIGHSRPSLVLDQYAHVFDEAAHAPRTERSPASSMLADSLRQSCGIVTVTPPTRPPDVARNVPVCRRFE
jgi:integrase